MGLPGLEGETRTHVSGAPQVNFRTHQPVLGGRTGEDGARGLTAPATWPRPPC